MSGGVQKSTKHTAAIENRSLFREKRKNYPFTKKYRVFHGVREIPKVIAPN